MVWTGGAADASCCVNNRRLVLRAWRCIGRPWPRAGNDIDVVPRRALAGGAFRVTFPVGHSWRGDSLASRSVVSSNPPPAFLLLPITGVHGLHLMGGPGGPRQNDCKGVSGGRGDLQFG